MFSLKIPAEACDRFPAVHDPQFFISQGDAVDFLKGLPSSHIDLVITDPPYESLEKHRAIGTTTRLKHSKSSSNDWFSIFPNARFHELFSEIFRVLKRDSHFYLFCDVETMFVAKPIAEKIGFKFWKPLIWDKKRIGMGYHYRARYECILFFEKGKRRLNNLGIPDIIEAGRIIKGYPTEKPVSVSEVLIQQSSQPKDLVVDPFAGSGSVGMASIIHGRRFLGNDINLNAVGAATSRLVGAGGSSCASTQGLLCPEAPAASSDPLTSTRPDSKLSAGFSGGEVPTARANTQTPGADNPIDASAAQLSLLAPSDDTADK